MSGQDAPTLEQLFATMLRTRYYVVDGVMHGGDPAAMQAHLRDHILYMIDLERRGLLLAGGPFLDEEGAQTGNGMAILRARSSEEALALAQDDPMVRAGLRTVSVRPWIVNEGSMSVTVRFSDGSGMPG